MCILSEKAKINVDHQMYCVDIYKNFFVFVFFRLRFAFVIQVN